MKKYAAITMVAVSLWGCGGGGGGGNAASNPAQGIWNGTFKESNGNTTDLFFVALENGELWGSQVTAATNSGGVMHGKIDASNGAFKSSLRFYLSNKDTISNSDTDGNYKSGQSLNFTGQAAVNTIYNNAYDSKASLSDLAGEYNGNAMSKNNVVENITVGIDAKGNISAGDQTSCLISGKATPRASGKNVFDVTLSASGPDCPTGDKSSTAGIGVLLGKELTLLTENPAKTDVVGFSGDKN
jgi:hypothetical protein